MVEIIAIGASTGGPPVILSILANLRKDFPMPILIVQHIPPGCIQGMVEWLNKETPHAIEIPETGDTVKGGRVYFAPANCHMGITDRGEIVLSNGNPENSVLPSSSCLFRFVAKAYGKRAIGILLTGMGKDGALELKVMKDKGAVTMAQNKESCVVYGMPEEAVKPGGVEHVFSSEQIVAF